MSRYPWRDTSQDIAEQAESQWETPSGAQAKADAAVADHVATGTHSAENIVESPGRRFASDAKIASWDAKADGNLATQMQKGLMAPEDKAKLDKSTNGMTPETLMIRDAGGRAKVAAPSAANDIARKQEVDDVQGNLDTHAANMDAHLTPSEHAKLTGISPGAEVNQNAFSKINDITAGSKTDAINIKGSTGITVTTNQITKEVVVTATGSATPGAHASSHITGGTDVIPSAVIDGNSGLMTGADAAFVRRDGETKSGADVKATAAKETAMAYAEQLFGSITPGGIGAETPSGAQAKVDALGTTVTALLAERVAKVDLAATTASKGASLVGVQDAAGHFSGATVEAVLAELFTLANNGKLDIASVVGSPATSGDTFAQLKARIQTIKDSLATNLTGKGQASAGTETLAALAAKVANVNTGKRFARGTATTDNSLGRFSVSGLAFKPAVIVFILTAVSDSFGIVYDLDAINNPTGFTSVRGNYRVMGDLRTMGYVVITTSGATNIDTGLGSAQVQWVAFEGGA